MTVFLMAFFFWLLAFLFCWMSICVCSWTFYLVVTWHTNRNCYWESFKFFKNTIRTMVWREAKTERSLNMDVLVTLLSLANLSFTLVKLLSNFSLVKVFNNWLVVSQSKISSETRTVCLLSKFWKRLLTVNQRVLKKEKEKLGSDMDSNPRLSGLRSINDLHYTTRSALVSMTEIVVFWSNTARLFSIFVSQIEIIY